MSIFMNIVKQASELAKGRGRVSFVVDLEKWLPGRGTQAQPEDTWRVSWFESLGAGAACCSAKGRDAQEALVRMVAAMMKGEAPREADTPARNEQAIALLEELARRLNARPASFGAGDLVRVAATVDRALKILRSE